MSAKRARFCNGHRVHRIGRFMRPAARPKATTEEKRSVISPRLRDKVERLLVILDVGGDVPLATDLEAAVGAVPLWWVERVRPKQGPAVYRVWTPAGADPHVPWAGKPRPDHELSRRALVAMLRVTWREDAARALAASEDRR